MPFQGAELFVLSIMTKRCSLILVVVLSSHTGWRLFLRWCFMVLNDLLLFSDLLIFVRVQCLPVGSYTFVVWLRRIALLVKLLALCHRIIIERRWQIYWMYPTVWDVNRCKRNETFCNELNSVKIPNNIEQRREDVGPPVINFNILKHFHLDIKCASCGGAH